MGFRRDLASAVPENRLRFTGHPEHVHEVPHLVHMIMGRGVLSVDGAKITLEPRTSAWLAADVPHALALDEHSIALGPFLSPHVTPVGRVRCLGVVPAITDLMLARLAAQPTTDEQCALFTDGLDEILLAQSTDQFDAPMPVHPTVVQIAEIAVDSPATLAVLCQRVGLSTRQAQRIFVAETGMSFHRWRTRRRLNRAVRSMRNGSTGESAARVAGFATRASLLRALSRESGVPVDDLRADPLAHLPLHAATTVGGGQTASTAITVIDPGATSV